MRRLNFRLASDLMRLYATGNGFFVVKEHHATNLHFDLRLAINYIARSWAFPKVLTMKPFFSMRATEVPDHPLRSMVFEGTRRAGLYGAGEVCTWDYGSFKTDGDISLALKKGRVIITLYGFKLKGKFEFRRNIDDYFSWTLVKLDDEYADPNSELETILKPRKFPGFQPLFESLDC